MCLRNASDAVVAWREAALCCLMIVCDHHCNLVAGKSHGQSLVAEQGKLPGDDIQARAQTRGLVPFRFRLKAEAGETAR